MFKTRPHHHNSRSVSLENLKNGGAEAETASRCDKFSKQQTPRYNHNGGRPLRQVSHVLVFLARKKGEASLVLEHYCYLHQAADLRAAAAAGRGGGDEEVAQHTQPQLEVNILIISIATNFTKSLSQ